VGLLDRLRPPKPYRELRAADAQAELDRGALLIDVRDQKEWDAGHAPTAFHVPLRKLPERIARLPAGRSFVVVCRSGNRSRTAAELLAAKRPDVAHVSGGMKAWAKAGLPVVDRAGGSGRIV
jgi:rhodanese-related sulfurtransferase